MSNGVGNINIFKIKDSSIYFLVSICLYELVGNFHKIEAQCLYNSDPQNFKHQKHCTKHFINTQQSFFDAPSTHKVAVTVTNSAVNSHIYPPCAFCPASKSTILNTFQVPMCHVMYTPVPLHITFLLPANPSLLCSPHHLPLMIKLRDPTTSSEPCTHPFITCLLYT